MKVRVDFKTANVQKRVLSNVNEAQKWLDNQILKDSAPFVPRRNGDLELSGIRGTKIGSGQVVYNSPYARYQYYAKLMVDPETKKGAMFSPDYGFWSRPGVKKVLTNRDLKHSTTPHAKATRLWFESAKALNKEAWIKGVRKIGGGG